MPVVMPPVSGTASGTWAILTFAGPYLKDHPQAAPSAERGLVVDDLRFGEARAQNILEPFMIQFYGADEVSTWEHTDTGTTVPPLVYDWSVELAAAQALHHAAASGRLERREHFRDWIAEILQRIKDWLAEYDIQDVDGEIIEQLTTPERSQGRGPVVSDQGREEVFNDSVLEDLVENHSPVPREYTTDEEDTYYANL